jgi:hypothetical protein
MKNEVGQSGSDQKPPNFKKSFAGSSKTSLAKLPGRAPGIVHGRKLTASMRRFFAERKAASETITTSAGNPSGRGLKIGSRQEQYEDDWSFRWSEFVPAADDTAEKTGLLQ